MSEVDNTHLNDLQLLAVPHLMGKHFFIPDYQRGYRWERNQVYRLLEAKAEGAKRALPLAVSGAFRAVQPPVQHREQQ